MNHTLIPPAATIRARVHESALKRVTKLYASNLGDVFTETLQNARRSGATRVRVTVGTNAGQSALRGSESSETTLTVTVTDDGTGIEDPAVLLSFGENGWNDDLVAPRGRRRHGDPEPRAPRLPDRIARRARPAAMPGTAGRSSLSRNTSRAGATPRFGATTARRILPALRRPVLRPPSPPTPSTPPIANAARHYPLPVMLREHSGYGTRRRGARTQAPSSTAPSMPRTWNGLVFGVYRDRLKRLAWTPTSTSSG